MEELKLISPILDNLAVGGPISDHHGIRCYPAMDEATGNKYIVKVISVPASRTQLDAFLLSGAYADEAAAMVYFKEQAEDIVREADVLEKLSQLEGYFAYEKAQLVSLDNDEGLQIYLLGSYKHTLERALQKAPMTQLAAVNLGLDLCAALTVCRRSGYLYADLKPSNIFITNDNGYRIGDLGFLQLDSLSYASLPDRYRSLYTAPEIADAFSSLNTTIDVYAVGMILYQIYNNGELPDMDPDTRQEPLPAPANADYEMSEIILKACAPNPEDRWEDPIQMGQALVAYMQRNGANDTPIVPPVLPVDEEPVLEPAPAEEAAEEPAEQVSDAPDSVVDNTPAEPEPEAFTVPDFQDDELGNLAVLLQPSDDETAPEYNETEVDYADVSPEINDILVQADEIVSHPVPEPAVAPEAIEVPVPEPIPVEEAVEEAAEDEDVPADDAAAPEEQPAEAEEVANAEASGPVAVAEDTAEDTQRTQPDEDSIQEQQEPDMEPEDAPEPPKKKKSNWLLYVILVLLLLGLVVVGTYFYRNYYLLPIDSLVVDGKENYLTVTVETPVDESLLTVVCKGQHGDELSAPLKDGTATFTNLKDDTGYVISLKVSGFHKLTGETTKGYSTPKTTTISAFDVYTGSVSGSVNIVFSVTGTDTDDWRLTYSATGEAKKIVTLHSKNETISGLSVDKEYTFTLEPDAELYLTGENVFKHVVRAPAFAQHLAVNSCMDGAMKVSWLTPKGYSGSWTINCTNEDGTYVKEVTCSSTDTTEATFEDIDPTASYTITVTAEGMQSGVSITKNANAPALSNVNLTTTATGAQLTWEAGDAAGPWNVTYSADGLQIGEAVTAQVGQFTVEGLIPGTIYCITIKTQDGTVPLGGTVAFKTADAEPFQCSYGDISVTAKDMTISLCTPPFAQDWTHGDLAKDGSDYTRQFKVDEFAGVVIQLPTAVGQSNDLYTRVFAIYDQDNKLVASSYSQNSWNNMWPSGNMCDLTIPTMPTKAGVYTLCLYFNGQLVTTQEFTVTQ